MYDVKNSFRAASVQEVFEICREYPEAVLVSGGTDVMIKMKERKLRDAVLVQIAEIPELQGIRMDTDGDIVIGPATVFDTIYTDPLARKWIPMLADACNTVGSPQIRHIATIGGNLCNGAVSADSVPSLLALNAVLVLSSEEGERTVPVTQFHIGPGKTVLQTGHELLTSIRIPKSSYEGHGGCYIKFGQRNAMEISTLGCAVNCALAGDGTIADYAIAFGVAASRPIRCPKSEEMMIGERPTGALLQDLRTSVLSECTPRDSWRASIELREQLIRELAERATRTAVKKAGGKIDD